MLQCAIYCEAAWQRFLDRRVHIRHLMCKAFATPWKFHIWRHVGTTGLDGRAASSTSILIPPLCPRYVYTNFSQNNSLIKVDTHRAKSAFVTFLFTDFLPLIAVLPLPSSTSKHGLLDCGINGCRFNQGNFNISCFSFYVAL